jgi:predicted DNA-binding transcriptional regulator YafY
MRRIERLLNLIIALLNTDRPWTAEEVRERIEGYGGEPNHEAFRRTFERDKEDLRKMGIPIETVTTDVFSEVPDGYIIPKTKYYLPNLELEPDELAALHLAAAAVLGSREQAEAGLLKLSVGPDASPGTGPRVLWSADVAAQQPLLPPLSAALMERAPVAFDYRPATGDPASREVEIYSLINRRGHWYVVGRDRGRDALRSFKVARIEGELTRLDGTYEIPPDFRAEEKLPAQAWEVGPDQPADAILRFSADMRWWAEQNLPGEGATDGPKGSLDVHLPVANLDALISWVLELGPDVEIVAPPAARERLTQHLEAFLSAVAG